jgi:MoxR-like ATPase
MSKRLPYSIADINARLIAKFGPVVTRQNLLDFRASDGVFAAWLQKDASLKVGRGAYRIPGAEWTPADVASVTPSRKTRQTVVSVTPQMIAAPVSLAPVKTAVAPSAAVVTVAANARTEKTSAILSKLEALRSEASLIALIPEKDPTFVSFGDAPMVEQIIESRIFYPVFITGLSGNGKTHGIEQACAQAKREYIRANVTIETEEDDLLGGFRLHNGETDFEPGPVVVAMVRGAVLLLDEIDLASAKIMCLQPVLEGKPVTLKKYGVTITPAPGFTIFATANTKGRGSEDGRFVGTGLLNEAFLERFPITIEQEYPSVSVEKKILCKNYEQLGKVVGKTEEVFFETLSKWAEAIRVAFKEEAIEDVISTRRLIHIVKAYAIFGAQDKALAYCLNRFDAKVQDAFSEFYNKLVPNNTPSTVGHVDPNAPTF